jgi:hypothetical protein
MLTCDEGSSFDNKWPSSAERAVKGDDSDGQIAWNVKSRIAACALMTVYVGKSFSRSHQLYTQN